jgi:hypothetical protein
MRRPLLPAMLLLAATASAADLRLTDATSRLGEAARTAGLTEADARQATDVLTALVKDGLPVTHALEVVQSALSARYRGPEIAAIARAAGEAHRRGASSYEIVRLTRDLTEENVGSAGIRRAIDAVGRLAEDGYEDAETRRGVSRTAIEGSRREMPAERVREEAQRSADHARDEPGAPAAASGNSASGHDRADEAHDRNNLRDELRRNPPPGLPADHGPAGVPERGRPDSPGRSEDPGKPDKPDKPDKPEDPKPDKPDKPEDPKPDKPEDPKPDKPEDPKPDKPDKPDDPKPDKPDDPKPDKPDKPEDPKPDKPEKPDKEPSEPGNGKK